ncbi:hypothetical protein BJ138DRAFT_630240 [Hygrophoropsis aurantiaca]|uniref:Uncharacterized protein n=1 Tax=Hygrophoropsis aurantiaca TaxID=72124 RepID=A0ACB8A092_9AGAM|nr:hypothetical protein BJ138DRAFT_630240 [Hygrophoropsis aurantiaca]
MNLVFGSRGGSRLSFCASNCRRMAVYTRSQSSFATRMKLVSRSLMGAELESGTSRELVLRGASVLSPDGIIRHLVPQDLGSRVQKRQIPFPSDLMPVLTYGSFTSFLVTWRWLVSTRISDYRLSDKVQNATQPIMNTAAAALIILYAMTVRVINTLIRFRKLRLQCM